MLTILLSPAAFRPSVPLAPLRPLRSSLPARSLEAAMVTPADIDPILQDMPVFDAPADAGVSPVAAFVVCFLIAFLPALLLLGRVHRGGPGAAGRGAPRGHGPGRLGRLLHDARLRGRLGIGRRLGVVV